MPELQLQQIKEAIHGHVSNECACIIKGFSTDTRSLTPGNCFIALKGEFHDGHKFLELADKMGASAAIVEKTTTIPSNIQIPIIQVDNTLKALMDVAKYHYEQLSPLPIGITGSMGKTTTKELCFQILAHDRHVLKSPKSFNNNIGVPLTLLSLEPEHQIAILELGANHFGEIKQLSQLIKPKIGVISCVAPSHLEGFGNIDGVMRAKGELLKGMNKGGTLVVNGDDARCLAISQEFQGKVITFGHHKKCNFRIGQIRTTESGTRFELNGKAWKTPLIGQHNIYNLTAAIAVATEIGLSTEQIHKHSQKLSLPAMRMEITQHKEITFINDAYNANPQAMLAATSYLATCYQKRKIAIIGSMLELGSGSKDLHRDTGKQLGKYDIDLYFVIGQEAEAMYEGILESGYPSTAAFYFETIESAIPFILSKLQAKDIVLLKASRCLKFESLQDNLMQKFILERGQ